MHRSGLCSKTVEVLNRALPEIEIKLADIRCLPFEDGLFAGCGLGGDRAFL